MHREQTTSGHMCRQSRGRSALTGETSRPPAAVTVLVRSFSPCHVIAYGSPWTTICTALGGVSCSTRVRLGSLELRDAQRQGVASFGDRRTFRDRKIETKARTTLGINGLAVSLRVGPGWGVGYERDNKITHVKWTPLAKQAPRHAHLQTAGAAVLRGAPVPCSPPCAVKAAGAGIVEPSPALASTARRAAAAVRQQVFVLPILADQDLPPIQLPKAGFGVTAAGESMQHVLRRRT
jgi:hypothetical protein